jgi:hypothetical protein
MCTVEGNANGFLVLWMEHMPPRGASSTSCAHTIVRENRWGYLKRREGLSSH